MNLIFIYGPPASGKLTVGTALAKKTGYKLFHNHLTIDVARELYPDFDEQMFGLVHKLRLDTIEYAAEQGTNIILTYVYTGDEEDRDFVDTVVATAKANNGIVRFVQLVTPSSTLLDRVSNESRHKVRKMTDKGELKAYLAAHEIDAEVPYPNLVRLDTSTLAPNESADAIIEYFDLA